MRVLLQKVTTASVEADGETIARIGRGYLLFIGVIAGDSEEQARWIARKVLQMRLFPGEDGKMNDRSILDISGDMLGVSQFTLAGRTERGNRPDYTRAAEPREAERLYEYVLAELRASGLTVQSGRFGAAMQVTLTNDGPVTLLLER